jgi:hypothetical protein
MKIIDPNNQVQKEALLNEYKGNLFEYMVGSLISRDFKSELAFFNALNKELKERLSMYEEFVRSHYPDLINKLMQLSLSTKNALKTYLLKSEFHPTEVYLIGKAVATNDNNLWAEADLVLHDQDKRSLNLSLKLSKGNSFTNTKSAGIKSFLAKYFNAFENAKSDQEDFNRSVDFNFNKMGERLYSMEGMSFSGHFDADWSNRFTELPGELDPIHRSIVFENYSHLAQLLHFYLTKYLEQDANVFKKALYPLLGFGDINLIQVTVFHNDHDFQSIKILEGKIFNQAKVELLPLKENAHSVEIIFGNYQLQLRIKPMNKFTTASYKVNCSIKEYSP